MSIAAFHRPSRFFLVTYYARKWHAGEKVVAKNVENAHLEILQCLIKWQCWLA